MRKGLIPVLFILALIAVIGYAQFPKYLYGVISYYGDEYAGKKTANGDVYDPQKYTAAHKTLPFGTDIEVENLENGKKVTLKINDRGPFVENRIMDVSRKAAEDLGFTKKGTVYCKITIIRIGDNKSNINVNSVPAAETNTTSSAPEMAAAVSSAPSAAKASSSAPSVTAAISNNSAAVSVVPTATPSGNTGSTALSVATQKTNILTLQATNTLTLTNYVRIPVTNFVDVQPYQEKTVEMPITDTKPAGNILPPDEFIVDEPIDAVPLNSTPVPAIASSSASSSSSSSAVPAVPVTEPVVNTPVLPVTIASVPAVPITSSSVSSAPASHAVSSAPSMPAVPVVPLNNPSYSEIEITPDLLLSNETAVKIESKEIKNEALNEAEKNAISEKGISYVIQIGAFSQEQNAMKLYDELRKKGFSVFTIEDTIKKKKFVKVRIGYYNTIDLAKKDLNKLKSSKLQGTIIKIKE